MAVTITYFVHGTSTDNENDISSGWSDAELSVLGIEQSKNLKKLINIHDFDIVFCSDLKRAVTSAKLTFGDDLQIVTDSRLRECNYGDYNGKPSSVVEPLQVQSIDKPMLHGESYEDVKTRIAEFLNDLKAEYDGKSVAIVAHKAPQLALDVLVQGKSWGEAFKQDWRITKSWKPGWTYIVN
jgi:broad specificity phosphatase PhoE